MTWITDNYIEVFGAVTGILYVILEIRQNRLLWPVGIVTSAVYIWVFFTGRLYADMGLQAYYLVISVMGWYWWARGGERRAESREWGAESAELRPALTEASVAQGRELNQETSPFEGGEGDVLDDVELRENSVYSVVKKGSGREQEAQGAELRAQSGGQGAGSRELNLEDSPFESRRDRRSQRGKGDVFNNVELRENSVYSVVKKGSGRAQGAERRAGEPGNEGLLKVTRLKRQTGIVLFIVFVLIFSAIWYLLDRFTDSPVPVADSFITSLSIIATWMLARKIYEHWYLWMVVNSFATVLFFTRALYPTAILYMVYFIMSFTGLFVWRKDLPAKTGSTAG